jgi:glucose 1-dehydrogenase
MSRVVVVTGAGSGIGRAIAVRFAREGELVVVNDVVREAAEETVRLACEGGEAVADVADIGLAREARRLVLDAAERFGAIDVLVANAGISLDRPFLEATEEELDRILAVNVKGVFFCGQEAARQMVATGRPGHIVNIASTYAEVCEPGCAAYCASKGGVRMLTKAMAVELGPLGIHVNAVAPGFILTPMNVREPDEKRRIEERIPLGYMAGPESIASVVWFLASPDAAYMQGDTVFVDGGWVLQ